MINQKSAIKNKSKMILVFGGTTEGKQTIEMLKILQIPFIYSTKTKIKVELPELAKYRYGAFTVLTLAEYIRVHKITLIIHAAHPFATELHTTIDQAAQFKNIPVLRIEREYPIRTCHENVHYVESYDEISNMLNDKYSEKTSLFLTGVQSINKLESHWKTEKSYFRILDRETSIETALAQDFPQDQLILGDLNTCINKEVELIKENKIDVMVTKESGESGSLSVKIEAALKSNISIIVLIKPHLPNSFQIITDVKELAKLLYTHA